MASVLISAIGQSASAQDYAFHPATSAVPTINTQPESPNCNASIPFSNFVGQKIVFQPKTLQFRQFGYDMYHIEVVNGTSPSYDQLAGQVAVIDSIGAKDSIGFQDVKMHLENNGQVIMAQSLHEVLQDITFLADINAARAKWVGKTIWYRGNRVRTSQDVEVYDGNKVLKFHPVKVVNVIAGTSDPLDFVVQSEGGPLVLVNVRFSASNFGSDMIETFAKMHRHVCNFDEQFDVVDPRTTHKWPAAIWGAIERSEVIVGMTIDQAIMAWGEPKDINDTQTPGGSHAQWVYGQGRYLYVDRNNRISAVQQ